VDEPGRVQRPRARAIVATVLVASRHGSLPVLASRAASDPPVMRAIAMKVLPCSRPTSWIGTIPAPPARAWASASRWKRAIISRSGAPPRT